MHLATQGAIIGPYRPCRDVLSICILCSHRLLNSHVNFSGPNGDGFHLPASLLCWLLRQSKWNVLYSWDEDGPQREELTWSLLGRERWLQNEGLRDWLQVFPLGHTANHIPLPHLLPLGRRDNATCLMGSHRCWSQWPAVSEAELFWVRGKYWM